jgi:hypothetical protein
MTTKPMSDERLAELLHKLDTALLPISHAECREIAREVTRLKAIVEDYKRFVPKTFLDQNELDYPTTAGSPHLPEPTTAAEAAKGEGQ